MNREKDFHKKSAGVIINVNTRDYRRAKNRNKVMKTAVTALGDGGELSKVSQKVNEFSNSPSRAERRVITLEEELNRTKKFNKEIKKKLDDTLQESAQIKEQLFEANRLNQEISDKMTDILRLEQMIKNLENK